MLSAWSTCLYRNASLERRISDDLTGDWVWTALVSKGDAYWSESYAEMQCDSSPYCALLMLSHVTWSLDLLLRHASSLAASKYGAPYWCQEAKLPIHISHLTNSLYRVLSTTCYFTDLIEHFFVNFYPKAKQSLKCQSLPVPCVQFVLYYLDTYCSACPCCIVP